PHSTLFPYTTLFRSLIVAHGHDHAFGVAHGPDGAVVRHGVADLDRRRDRVCLHPVTPRESLAETQCERRRTLRLDRGETGEAVRSEEHTSELQSPYD